jgi:hypothetical protein
MSSVTEHLSAYRYCLVVMIFWFAFLKSKTFCNIRKAQTLIFLIKNNLDPCMRAVCTV